jgi:tRNA A37 threonylcarbamoyladenosine synthetase subunit TsaC/SUA5/YrdC
LILPAAAGLPSGVAAPGGTVAVRVPELPALCDLVLAVGFPLISTSANLSGGPALTDLEGAFKAFMNEVDGVWQPAGNKKIKDSQTGARPSALIDLTTWPGRLLREGPRQPPAVD